MTIIEPNSIENYKFSFVSFSTEEILNQIKSNRFDFSLTSIIITKEFLLIISSLFRSFNSVFRRSSSRHQSFEFLEAN